MTPIDFDTLLTQTRTGCFTLRTDCTECAHPVPLNGPQTHAHCNYCQSELEIPEGIYVQMLEELEDRYFELTEGKGSSGTVEKDRFNFHYEYWRAHPACEKCAEPFLIEALEPGTTGNFACVSCGDPGSTFPAPEWLKRRVTTAVQIYSIDPDAWESQPGGGAAPKVEEAVAPVVMACPQCSSSLNITAELKRVHSCLYCDSEIYLPDPIWLRLHPVKKIARWYVAFQGESAALVRLRREEERQRHTRSEREQRLAQERAERDAQHLREEEERKRELRAEIPARAAAARRMVALSYLLGAATLGWGGAAVLGELAALGWWTRFVPGLLLALLTATVACWSFGRAAALLTQAGDAFKVHAYVEWGRKHRTDDDLRIALLLPAILSWSPVHGAGKVLGHPAHSPAPDTEEVLRLARYPFALSCFLLGPGWPVLVLSVVAAALA
ncbi:MAG: hypothetical protein ABI333_10885 [bacterium]